MVRVFYSEVFDFQCFYQEPEEENCNAEVEFCQTLKKTLCFWFHFFSVLLFLIFELLPSHVRSLLNIIFGCLSSGSKFADFHQFLIFFFYCLVFLFYVSNGMVQLTNFRTDSIGIVFIYAAGLEINAFHQASKVIFLTFVVLSLLK